MVPTSYNDKEEEPEEMAVVVMADAVIDPWAMMI